MKKKAYTVCVTFHKDNEYPMGELMAFSTKENAEIYARNEVERLITEGKKNVVISDIKEILLEPGFIKFI